MEDRLVDEAPAEEKSPGTSFFEKLHKEWVEIIAAVLLALATIASAWSAFQAASWHGIQASLFNRANADRIHASEKFDLADQELGIDIEMYTEYLDALYHGNEPLMDFYMNHAFRDEMKVAMKAWLATEPLNNPDSPDTPFKMKEYKCSLREEAQKLDESGSENSDSARQAIKRADDYVLLTVLFASVLFFAGVGTKFKAPWVKITMVVMGWILFGVATSLLFTMPVA